MNFNVKNIAVGLGILGLLALGSWNLDLQRRSNDYQAALQSEKNDSSKKFKEINKENSGLREKLRELNELNEVEEINENCDQDVNVLKIKL